MATDRELLQMALEALDSKHDMTKAEWRVLQYHAFTALRARLAQPEQEPVAWKMKGVPAFATSRPNDTDSIKWDALYTAPSQREWQGLTDEEIESLWDNTLSEDVGITALRKSALAIEAKLKEKNYG